MLKLAPALVAAATVLALSAGSASAEERMWIGFHDDPTLRYGPNRLAELDKVRGANATIVRTLVEWRSIAPKRPQSATNAFDPAYRFADLDELVRNTQQRGMEVLMTIWGTPKWANGGKGPAYLPTKMADFQNFARALATRYNGRRAGYPFVKLLRDLERVEPRQLPRPAVRQRRARSSAPPPTRSWRRPATPGSKRAARRRWSRSARPRPTARTSRSRARPTRPRPARSRSWSRRRTRSSSSTPGRSTRTRCR